MLKKVLFLVAGIGLGSLLIAANVTVRAPIGNNNAGSNVAFMRSYTKVINLSDRTTGKWAAADSSMRAFSFRAKNAGSINVFSYSNSAWVTIYADDYDIFNLEIDSINFSGTTADSITVFGWSR